MTDPLATLLAAQDVVILDGGLATELEARGHDLSGPLWSARLLRDAPAAIGRVHHDYLEAGADCIVSASYQASVAGHRRLGLSHEDAAAALRRSVRLAREARDDFWDRAEHRSGRRPPLVAAGVGPYGAFLADGSEYTGRYDLDAAGLARFHRPQLSVLAGAGADLLACETIPSAPEARVLASLLEEHSAAPAWISFSCRDGERISDGTPFAEIAVEVAASPAVAAVGINCTAPRHLPSLIAAIAGQTAKPIVVYPNSGEPFDRASRRWLSGAGRVELAAEAPSWVALGARIVGGCCRTGPADIRRLRRRLLGDGQSTSRSRPLRTS